MNTVPNCSIVEDVIDCAWNAVFCALWMQLVYIPLRSVKTLDDFVRLLPLAVFYTLVVVKFVDFIAFLDGALACVVLELIVK